MALSARKAAMAAMAQLLAGGALAMGLGEATGRAVLGQPLRIEIPVLGSGGSLPARSCFRLQTPRAEVGNEFAVRNARIDIVGGPRGARLIVTTAAVVTEPVIGFAVSAGCDIGLSRDYVLLVALPDTAPVAPAVETPRAAAPAEPLPPTKPAPEKKSGSQDEALRVEDGLTLDALARQKYPLQPKAREKFVRMMMQANPALTSTETPIAAGTELRLPPGLPQRRVGPYRGENAAAPQKASATTATAATPPTSRNAPARSGKAGKDRLVVGAMPESSESKLLADAERLTNMLIEQNKAQDELIANIAKLEADYAGLRKEFVATQAGLARIEAERAAERRAAEDSKSAQVIELLLAVLAGGAAGGTGLHWFQRRRMLRQADAQDVGGQEDDVPAAAAPPAAASPAIAGVPAEAVAAAEPPPAPAIMQGVRTVGAEPPPASPPEVPIPNETSKPQPVREPLNFSPVSLNEQEKSLAPLAVPAAGTPEPKPAEPQEALALDFPEISLPATGRGDSLDFHKG